MDQQVIQTKPIPYCPICGVRMVLRRPGPGQDWKPFWGCSQYPDCRGKRQIGPDGRPESDELELDELEW
jgi:ssDNA-binding Zn-finger/Zn-ribbon topoisomerase 1